MDLELTDEQRWLADAVAALLIKSTGPDAWPALVEFGAVSIAAGESEGVGAVELALVARALGERLQVTPFVDSAATAYALRIVRTPAPAFAALPSVAAALLEPGGSWDLTSVATALADSGEISGRKVGVAGPGSVDGYVVLAAGSGPTRCLAVIPGGAAGLSVTGRPTLDGALGVHELALQAVAVASDALLDGEATAAVLPRLLAVGGLLASAEAVGAAAALLELARQYATERRQFGRTIGSFQALRHLLADLYVKQAASWSTVLFASAVLDEDEGDALQVAAIAKAYVARATQEIAHGAMQVFGGISATEEHPAHLYLRRILSRGAQYGDARYHERSIGRAMARGVGSRRPVASSEPAVA